MNAHVKSGYIILDMSTLADSPVTKPNGSLFDRRYAINTT